MAEYRVTALKIATINVEKSAMTYLSGFGTRINLPVWAAAIEGNGIRALVDTGIRDHELWNRDINPCWHAPDETIDGALAELGWSSGDVDIVVNSHLHRDHAENNLVFRNARFIVSRAEWEYSTEPIPTQRRLYDFAWTDEVVTREAYHLIAVDNYELLPGLRIIQTPGHTRGHQSVVVDTVQGQLCIAGDAACLPESFARPTPPAGATSIEQGFASLERIRNSASRVFMNHDPNLSKFQDIDFPRMPAIGSLPRIGDIESLPDRVTDEGTT